MSLSYEEVAQIIKMIDTDDNKKISDKEILAVIKEYNKCRKTAPQTTETAPQTTETSSAASIDTGGTAPANAGEGDIDIMKIKEILHNNIAAHDGITQKSEMEKFVEKLGNKYQII